MKWRGCMVVGVTAGLLACSPDSSPARKMVVLAIDGMDHALLMRYIEQGRVPNLARLAQRGSFIPLDTSVPPQSPVAWSDVLTGHHSDMHGIYDFVHRDPYTRLPYLSTSRMDPGPTLSLGPWELALGSDEIELLREGRTFWELLGAAGHSSTVYKIPANYPPAVVDGARVLSGMGTPDLLGTYGTFQVVTSDESIVEGPRPGGHVHRARLDPQGYARVALVGPVEANSPAGGSLDLEVHVDTEHAQVLVKIGGARQIVRVGEWSPWMPIELAGPWWHPPVRGMVRAYVRGIEPWLYLYVSPINIDPVAPQQPIVSDPDYLGELTADVGRFYTQGMAEDTKALEAGLLTDDEFLAQADLVRQEDAEALRWHLAHDRSELLFFYLSSIDQVGHMFWRGLAGEPTEQERGGHVLPQLYSRVDALVGEVADSLADDTTLLVLSDHGFAAWTWEFHLNAWLAERGYLVTRDDVAFRTGSWDHVDWSRTQAYGVGINQLFLNLAGRERNGQVPPERRQEHLERIADELLSYIDPATGLSPVSRVVAPGPGAHPDRQPDLIVLYRAGYRNSDASAIGAVGNVVLSRNTKKWSGDHCIDPAFVPGVLLSSRPFAVERAELVDVVPSILDVFSVQLPADLPGRSVWQRSEGASKETP